jgi:hypothetical protein
MILLTILYLFRVIWTNNNLITSTFFDDKINKTVSIVRFLGSVTFSPCRLVIKIFIFFLDVTSWTIFQGKS